MNYEEEKEKLSTNKKIYLFKWFIRFLEKIYRAPLLIYYYTNVTDKYI